MAVPKIAKITSPIVTEVFPRVRLFKLLDTGRKRPVSWIAGPPGCGKTTLVSSYLDARKLPCLWYQVDQGDADPATFFYYLGLAAREAAPRTRKSLPLLTPEYLQGISTYTLRYFEDLFARLKVPSAVVFDNYQEIPNESPFHEIILHGLSIIPKGINIIMISRSDPPPALIRLRANHQMEILGWDELRLTLEESGGIIRLRSREKQTKETISLLHKAAGGWMAGLVLMLESVERKVIEPQALGKLTPEEIFDYFGNELFDKTDKEIRDFLLKTAFLPKMTAKMAEDLTGLPNARRILDALSRTHYFTEKRFHGEPVYQYHSLFREFLLSRAKSTFSKESLSVLCSRASTLLEEAGQAESAVLLLRDMKDWDGLVRLIKRHAPLMVAQGRFRPLEEWLSNLPNEILGNNPWLLYWKGVVYIPFNPSSSRKYLERAFEIFKRKGDVAGTFLSWSSIIEAIWYGLEDFKPLDRWVSVLQDLMRNFKEFPSKEIRARVASSMFIALAVRQPEHPEIEEWAEKALSFLEDHSTINARISVLVRQVFYRSFIGDFAKSELAVNALRNLAQSKDAGPLALIGGKYAESLFYRTIGLPERCLKAVSDGLELSQRTGIHVLDKMILLQGIFSSLSANDVEMAGKLLEKMASFSSLTPWEKCNFHLGKAWEALLRNDLKQASLHAEISLKFGIDLGVPFSLRVCHLMKALVMHQIGKNRDASEHLEHALSIAHQTKSKLHYFYVLLAGALFALDRGEEASTLESLRKALSIGKEERYFSTPILHSDMARLCIKALEAGIEVEYVQDFIRKHNLIPDNSSLHLENWPWPLKIYTLGSFRALKDESPLKFSRKTQQRPISMLKALIALGGKEIREDQISDALWPEADGDVAHESFATTLHRLRKLIGLEKAILLREGRLTLDERFCWVDVWAFERLLGQADARWREGLKDKAVQLMEKALEIYRGPFLAREPEPSWATAMSERLRNKFLRTVGKLGQYWQQASQWERALDCYQKGLEVDNLAEEFYQGLLTCYHHLGRRSEALSVYNRCKKALSSALGIEPSAKTESIYRSLRS